MPIEKITKSLNEITIEEDLKKRVIDLMVHLENLKIRLEKVHYTQNEKEFFSQMWEMWDFFKSYADEEAYEVFSHTQEFIEYKKFFTEKDGYFERALDSAEAINILGKNPDADLLDILDNDFSKNVFLQTQDEMAAINSDNIETIVMVGCGPAPETILYIAENTSIKKIIGIDADPEAIFMAGRVLHKMGLDERVCLVRATGENYDYKDADCIHMANFIRGKKETLDQISKTAKEGCKIITRQVNLLSNLAYERVFPDLHPRLIQKECIQGYFYKFYLFEKFCFNES